MHVSGFTPYATEKLLTMEASNVFQVHEPDAVSVFVMGGRDIRQRRIRRELRTTLAGAWIDYQGRWGMTHLWIIKGGRRHLVHRKH